MLPSNLPQPRWSTSEPCVRTDGRWAGGNETLSGEQPCSRRGCARMLAVPQGVVRPLLLVPEGLLSQRHEFLAFSVTGQDGRWGKGRGYKLHLGQWPQQGKGQTAPGAWEGSMMPAGTAAGAWVLVLALWGEPLPVPLTLLLAVQLPSPQDPPSP